MKLSVIIVNYNVKDLLEQCLQSVQLACLNLESEIIVIDNNSKDGSVQMVQNKFPSVILIDNKHNPGFSAANNQGIKIANGEYILLLNPDTLVQEDTFLKSMDFMDKHMSAGALGVRMIDGNGKYLPESKRALPTPIVSFYKIFGISRLFPHSRKFNKYYLGNLAEDEIHEVDVLTGAYMFMRKTALDKIGLLDEDFFMYGEDIDLSYRFLLGGYKNYYLPTTTIIHYKGESTKKGTLNYVYIFYQAMEIFAKKHFAKQIPSWFHFLIRTAIILRASLAAAKRLLQDFLLPLADVFLYHSFFYFFIPFWEAQLFGGNGQYPILFKQIIIPIYIGIWVMAIGLSGNYAKPTHYLSVLRNIALASLGILSVYGLLDNDYRFSRLIILAGAAAGAIIVLITRETANWLRIKQVKPPKWNNALLVCTKSEVGVIEKLIYTGTEKTKIVGFVSPETKEKGQLGLIHELDEIIRINRINQIIFSANSLKLSELIKTMGNYTGKNMVYKIASPEQQLIIGSKSWNVYTPKKKNKFL